jgi:hypothetical protein
LNSSEQIQWITDGASLAVRGACLSEEDIQDELQQLFEDEFGPPSNDMLKTMETIIFRLLHEQLLTEETWLEPTLNDKIDLAFAELERRGIVALQSAGFDVQGGWPDVHEEATDWATPPRGAVFYTEQDLESGVTGDGLYLAFGAIKTDDEELEAANLVIAREIIDVLGEHGVVTEWDGTQNVRIQIPPFEWRKRRVFPETTYEETHS